MSHKPNEIAELICIAYAKKTEIPSSKLILLAVIAGAYIGIGGYLYLVVSSDASKYIGVGIGNLISGMAFSLGLILVVLGGAELFTGNSLITVSCMAGRVKASGLLKNWALVYVGNLIGSLIVVGLILASGAYANNGGVIAERAVLVATNKVNLAPLDAFFRGILCNWLVCLAVWLAFSAEDTTGKILACIFPIATFVASGFEHSIANMFLIPLGMGISKGSVPTLTFMGLIGNLIPVTLGNIVGGAILVAAAYWYTYLKK
jgi:formate/nitrite transporter